MKLFRELLTKKKSSGKKKSSKETHKTHIVLIRVPRCVFAFILSSLVFFIIVGIFQYIQHDSLWPFVSSVSKEPSVRPLSGSIDPSLFGAGKNRAQPPRKAQGRKTAAAKKIGAISPPAPSEVKLFSNKTESDVAFALRELADLPFEEDLTYDLDVLGQKEEPLDAFKEGYDRRTLPHAGEIAYLVIVLDDLGMSMKQVRQLLRLNFPVTLAFWPHGPYTQEGTSLAHAHGLEILVHLPMEPISYPKAQPGPQALFVGMPEGRIREIVRAAVRQVPYAVGLNNHMGSRFTQESLKLIPVLEVMKEHGFFLLDSLTHAKSAFYREAVRHGLRAYRRNVFIDVVPQRHDILRQLRKAENLAKRTGQAVAIGHPLPETFAALELWEQNRDKSVQIVRLQDLHNE